MENDIWQGNKVNESKIFSLQLKMPEKQSIHTKNLVELYYSIRIDTELIADLNAKHSTVKVLKEIKT